MRTAIRWAAMGVVLTACAVAAYGAYRLAGYSWDQVAEYETPYSAMTLPAATSGPAQSDTLVLVIIDGLTDAASRTMTTLNSLRGYGADYVATVPQPSISFPSWTTILSGAPPYVSGVTTNSFKGPVQVETLLDTALAADRKVVVVGPTSFDALYGARRAAGVHLEDWEDGRYLAGAFVDRAVTLTRETTASVVLVHIEDVDEAGHDFGSDSPEYAQAVGRVDADLSRLVTALQGAGTTFVLLGDHGHVATGGHGGWEPEVVNAPVVFAGAGVLLGQGEAKLEDVAPTVAALAGIGSPRYAKGEVLERVMAADAAALRPAWAQRRVFAEAYGPLVTQPTGTVVRPPWRGGDEAAASIHGAAVISYMDDADGVRLRYDRRQRLPFAIGGVAVVVAVIVAIGFLSWRGLLAVLAGGVFYHATYSALFFLVHGLRWSLSSVNEEALLESFIFGRMAEAAGSAIVGALVAAFAYGYVRRSPKRPGGEFLPGWLSLGPVTSLVVIATLGAQVAWYVWWWGAAASWRLPDLKWGFKYDLDLVQATAVGFTAVLTSLATYLVGRYHPRVRRGGRDPEDSGSGATVHGPLVPSGPVATPTEARPDRPEE